MKILNKEDNSIIEVKDDARIKKLLAYPDKFEKIEEPKKEIKKDVILTEKVEDEPIKTKKNK